MLVKMAQVRASRVLLRIKLICNKENRPWKDIQQAWADKTGDEVTTNMLQKRYRRLKANLADVDSGHHDAFYAALEQVNNAIEKETKDLQNKKWVRVAKAMEESGTAKYDVRPSKVGAFSRKIID